MYGAIIGDIVGSRLEFTNNKTIDFELFPTNVDFTDDTVMTIAVADALLQLDDNADENTIKTTLIDSLKTWGQQYPHSGYGGMFYSWLRGSTMYQPYNSFGNGSAMRVSSVGWLYDTLEKTQQMAQYTAEITHNHPEGIKGAISTATVIWLARNNYTKNDIKLYIQNHFGYNLDRTIDEIRPIYKFNETCQETVPEAIISFLEGNSYEEIIRLAISLGGDADTIGAIAGSMAEACYEIPKEFISKANKLLTKDILSVIKKFHKVIGM